VDAVPTGQRLLVQLVALPPGRAAERSLYRLIEWGAHWWAGVLLSGTYRQRMLLRGDAATVSTLVDALAAATAQPGVRAVDLAIHPHGTTERLVLADGLVDVAVIAGQVQGAVGEVQRHRLRAVFSTACFGASHLDAWLQAGFVVATGARGIYADGATSVPVMFRTWAARRTVEQCVRSSNDDPTRHAQDVLASRYYGWTGRPGEAARVDSTRVVGGAGAVTVETDPTSVRMP
jgi:hypothetical protein